MKITENQFETLKKGIYNMLMGITMYAENGEEVTFGMGEMGECSDAAELVINEWIEKENISIEGDEKLEDDEEQYVPVFNNETIVITYLSEFVRRLSEGEDYLSVNLEIAERINNLYKKSSPNTNTNPYNTEQQDRNTLILRKCSYSPSCKQLDKANQEFLKYLKETSKTK